MQSTIALFGGASLLACIASCSKLPAQKELSTVGDTKAITPLSALSPQPSSPQSNLVDQEKPVEDVPLSKAFLDKLKQVPNEQDQEQYIGAIQELNRLSRKDPKNKAVLETLVRNQEKLLPILQTCGYKRDDGSSSFASISLYQSKFWNLSNGDHLIQLVCGTAYNLNLAFFIASGTSEKSQFKPLTLTEFYKDENGKIQRRESAGTSGGRCLDSPFDREGFYNESTKELCIWRKYIGMGICGTKGIYKLQNDKLILQKFTANFVCDYYNRNNNRYKTLYP